MNAIVFAPRCNTSGINPKTGRPWGDADEFLREGHAFLQVHGFDDRVCLFDNRRQHGERRAEVLGCLAKGREVSAVAWFCHGWEVGIQAGFTCQQLPELAAALKTVCMPDLVVALYCCTTGADRDPRTSERRPGPGGDGGFADRLRDELCELGVRATVYAHTVAGHTTKNPWVRVFAPDERAGGQWLVEPGSPLWPTWERLMQTTDVRLKYPFVSREALELWLTRAMP